MFGAGESWGHVCTVRVVLYWSQGQRYATLLKSPTQPEAVVPFRVTVRQGRREASGILTNGLLSLLVDFETSD